MHPRAEVGDDERHPARQQASCVVPVLGLSISPAVPSGCEPRRPRGLRTDGLAMAHKLLDIARPSRAQMPARSGTRSWPGDSWAGGTLGVGGGSTGEPVWLSDADCERVAAEHPKNAWVRRDSIARA